MNTKLRLLTLLIGFLGYLPAAQAQYWRTDYSALFAALKSQPLVVLLPEEDPHELRQLAGRPDDLAQYKAYVALHNTQMRQLTSKFWTISPAIEFRSEAERPALEKNKQQATLVLYQEQQRVGYGTGTYLSGVTFLDTKWYLALAGGRRQEFALSVKVPPDAMTAFDIVSALRNLQYQVQQEQLDATYTEYGRQMRQAAKARLVEYGQRLRTKTLLVDRAGLKEKMTEAELQKAYPYPHQLATLAEIEAAVLTADPHYTYVRNLSNTTFIVDAADGKQLAGVVGDKKWGKGEFKILGDMAKQGE